MKIWVFPYKLITHYLYFSGLLTYFISTFLSDGNKKEKLCNLSIFVKLKDEKSSEEGTICKV